MRYKRLFEFKMIDVSQGSAFGPLLFKIYSIDSIFVKKMSSYATLGVTKQVPFYINILNYFYAIKLNKMLTQRKKRCMVHIENLIMNRQIVKSYYVQLLSSSYDYAMRFERFQKRALQIANKI